MKKHSVLFPVLLIVGAASALQASAHSHDEDTWYFTDMDGDCHSVPKDQIEDTSKIRDESKSSCDGSHGKYLGQTHYGKREGRCAEITPKSSVFRFVASGKCDSDF